MTDTTHRGTSDRLYFRQLLSGRDFATEDPMARQMVNFVYLIGDLETGEAVVVDPAYDVDGILEVLAADDMRCTGALATHYHPDHVGGSMMGSDIIGAAELLERTSVPIHAQRDEAGFIAEVTGLGDGEIVGHDSGDVVTVGAIDIELIHTPGHTPGSQCFLVDGRLVAGDTLFLEGCGRTDLPGGDPAALYHSLHHRRGCRQHQRDEPVDPARATDPAFGNVPIHENNGQEPSTSQGQGPLGEVDRLGGLVDKDESER